MQAFCNYMSIDGAVQSKGQRAFKEQRAIALPSYVYFIASWSFVNVVSLCSSVTLR